MSAGRNAEKQAILAEMARVEASGLRPSLSIKPLQKYSRAARYAQPEKSCPLTPEFRRKQYPAT
jgi:hypothetical protein